VGFVKLCLCSSCSTTSSYCTTRAKNEKLPSQAYTIGVVNINSEVFPEWFFRHSLSQSNHSIFCIIDTPSEVFSDIKARFELDKIKGKNFLLVLRLSSSIKKIVYNY
jgi:hypothetical protein